MSRVTIPMQHLFAPGSGTVAAGARERVARALAALPTEAHLGLTVYGTNSHVRHVPRGQDRTLTDLRAAIMAGWLRSPSGGAWNVDGVAVQMIEGKAADRRIEIVAVVP